MSRAGADLERARILQLLAEDIVGGTELMVTQMAERMTEIGVHVEIATFFPPGPQARRLEAARIPVWSLGGSGPVLASRRLANLLRRRPYHVLEAQGFKMSVAGRLLAALMQSPTVRICSVQGLHITEVVELDEAKGRFALGVERALTGLVDGYAVNSMGALELLASAGIARHRMRYIPNAVDTEFWKPSSTTVPQEPPIVTCAARFVERKRQEDLIDAADLLRLRGIPFSLVFAGEGPTRNRCEEAVRNRGLQDCVRFSGALGPEELRTLLQRSSVFTLASVWEGMPAAVLEAMALGLPVVGTSVNGTADVVIHGRTGLLVPPRSPQRLADALTSVLIDRDWGMSLGAAGRREVDTRYAWASMIRSRLEFYADRASRRSNDLPGLREYAR